MRHSKTLCRFLLAIAISLGLAACGGSGGGGDDDEGDAGAVDTGTAGTNSTLSLRLTDAPGDLAHAWVDITAVVLEGEDGNGQTLNTTVFAGATGNIDLLTLDGVTRDVVLDVTVPSGSYRGMRVEFGNVVVETLDGTVVALAGSSNPDGDPVDIELECSSCGLGNPNVKLPDGVTLDLESSAKTLVLDFDVNQSFGRWPGDPGRWFFRPAIYAVDEGSYGSIVGTVNVDTGVFFPVCGGRMTSREDFTVLAADRADAFRSARVMPDGTYRFDYVVPGRYGMVFDQVVDFDTQELSFNAINPGVGFPRQVVVQAGATASMPYLINQVICSDRPPPP